MDRKGKVSQRETPVPSQVLLLLLCVCVYLFIEQTGGKVGKSIGSLSPPSRNSSIETHTALVVAIFEVVCFHAAPSPLLQQLLVP